MKFIARIAAALAAALAVFAPAAAQTVLRSQTVSYDNSAALLAVPFARFQAGAAVLITEPGRAGRFVKVTTNQSALATADTQNCIFYPSPQDGTGASGGWMRDYTGPIFFEWCGAKGDNSTNNATAVNGGIAAGKAIGYRSFAFGPGVFRFGSQITVDSSYLSISGSGIGATTLRRTFAAGDLFYIRDAVADTQITSVSIGDFSVDYTTRVTSGSMFYVEKASRFFMKNIVTQGGFAAIYLAGCFDCHLTDITNNFSETSATGEYGLIVTSSSVGYGSDRSGNIYVTNYNALNTFGSVGTPGATTGILLADVDGFWCTSCYVGHFASTGILLQPASASTWVTGVNFVNSWCDHYQNDCVLLAGTSSPNFSNITFTGFSATGGTSASYFFRDNGSNAEDVKVIGAALRQVNGDAIRLTGTGANWQIIGGTIESYDADNASGGECIYIAQNDVLVQGVTCDGQSLGDNGVKIASGSGIRVLGNRFVNNVNGILLQATPTNVQIKDNDARGNSSNACVDSGATTPSWSGNLGCVTENGGTATVVSGTTSIAVTHGLLLTPTIVNVTPKTTLNSAAKFWVSAIGATTFTINTDVNPGANVDFQWDARVSVK